MDTPLTKHTETRRPYTRPAGIPAAIESAQTVTPAEQRRRSAVADSSSSEYLPTEAINEKQISKSTADVDREAKLLHTISYFTVGAVTLRDLLTD